MAKNMLTLSEISILVGVSPYTINNWYKWKRLHADHPYAQYLPDFTQSGPRQTRYWPKDSAWSLIEFRNMLPKGRNGIMGDVTQPKRSK